MSSRTIAIGDVHGCSAALAAVLEAVDPRPEDTVVMLGDYVDRGPDCRAVVAQLIELATRCRLVPLMGNHEEMMLEIIDGAGHLFRSWLSFGGEATLASYDCAAPEEIPREHIEFLRGCRTFHEIDSHFFVHASYIKELPLEEQPLEVLRWDSLRYRLPGPHCSGKTAIVGHTSQKDGEIFKLDYLTCIDTCCYGEGWLTAMDIGSGQVWQADKQGRMKE
jgi:serine/threonine protein phosphatase 1